MKQLLGTVNRNAGSPRRTPRDKCMRGTEVDEEKKNRLIVSESTYIR